MRDELYSPTVTADTTRDSAARPSLARQLGASLRWAIVGLGVVLVIVGAYWALHVCSAMLQAVRAVVHDGEKPEWAMELYKSLKNRK